MTGRSRVMDVYTTGGPEYVCLVAVDCNGRILGDQMTPADPFDPATKRAVEWFVRLVGCDEAVVWREVWAAFIRRAVL